MLGDLHSYMTFLVACCTIHGRCLLLRPEVLQSCRQPVMLVDRLAGELNRIISIVVKTKWARRYVAAGEATARPWEQ